MIWIYMIISSLATAALSKGCVECNLTKPTITTKQCFGKLGEPLMFHLPTSTKKFTLKKNSDIIFSLMKNTDLTDTNSEKDKRMTFFNNGTFKLNKASKEDSGDYLLETFDSTNGLSVHIIHIHVEIQAPVSKPAVSQTCLSAEQMMVSCSSEGDGAEIILSLDNNLLNHSGAVEKHNITVSLNGQMTGNLKCDVQNNVSREQTVIQLTRCSGNISSHLSPLTVALISSVATLLPLLAVILGIKRFNNTTSNKTPRNKTTSPVTVSKDDVEDEIIYSDLKVMTAARYTRCN
ncbi:uncharacterized protein LOC125020777 [Mugil cephalus]|uniref:uncharacterized protein LOC125020777 n=1 Tax=Mugil cephalus TaxID=48193 RepID=UPI001FB656E0|nr:uncharacterized protein LOC125020777 [Mugil cephalus]